MVIDIDIDELNKYFGSIENKLPYIKKVKDGVYQVFNGTDTFYTDEAGYNIYIKEIKRLGE